MAAQVDVPIFAECDYKAKNPQWLQKQWWLAEDITEKPLGEALNLLCADFEYEWQLDQGVLLLRPQRWYLDPAQQQYHYPWQ